ncbi:hypothetical protein L2Y90_01675 [Burkholderia pyrrocinia]|uniref:hypothetical protein n=1 Tax=Burkholderia pyrrocinia TaxID=60550 RepID=UPI00215B7347|nr:hypothetical protein [Burkholderia pyrrocinia]UVE65864.1 hypothetical protein L2Y90_01675 [Burkholderia pyrrocinia]
MHDFAIDDFLFLGPLIALGGLVVWLYNRGAEASDDGGQAACENEKETPSAANRDAGT